MPSSQLIAFLRQLRQTFKGLGSFRLIRYYEAWRRSQESGRSPLGDRQPWMTFESIRLIDKKLKPFDIVFEYGGGGSTLFLLDRGAEVVTVEHDRAWFEMLTNATEAMGVKNRWTGILEAPEANTSLNSCNASDPDAYRSDSSEFSSFSFKRYVRTIDTFAAGHFDLVIIDGRSRPSCLKHAACKIKKGGYLVLDNAEREYYLTPLTDTYLEQFELILDEVGPSPYVSFFTKTVIWMRTR